MNSGGDPSEPASLERSLGLWTGLAISVGTMIGSGIFFKPNVMAESLGSLPAVLSVWLGAGLLSALGAMVYAELACAFPRSGGGYVYVREAYGPYWAFLLSWTELVFMRPAATGALAVAAASLLGLSGLALPLTAIFLILLLTALNARSTVGSGHLQMLAFLFKVGALLLLATLPLWSGGGHLGWGGWTEVAGGGTSSELRWGAAFLAALWAYDGWYNVAVVSEEIAHPQRNLPRALLGGVLLVTGLYLLLNLGLHSVLSLEQIAASPQPAADAARQAWGAGGEGLVRLLILGSVLGTLNVTVLCAPRVVLALARDRHLPAPVARLHPRFGTPNRAVWLYGLYCCVLIGVGELWRGDQRLFDLLTDLVVFAVLGFSVLTAASVLVLRRTRPELERPFRCWGYPWLPLLSVASLVALFGLSLWESPKLLYGSGLSVMVGSLLYALRRRR